MITSTCYHSLFVSHNSHTKSEMRAFAFYLHHVSKRVRERGMGGGGGTHFS